MQVAWTVRARADLRRVYELLAPKNPLAAARIVEALSEAPGCLLMQPRIGQRIETITEREVRRLVVGQYEVRYGVVGDEVRIFRIFHTLEDR